MTRYLSLAEFWYLAERHRHQRRNAHQSQPRRARRSALHAPQAGFGDTDFYPDVNDKAAVLACRIAWNHPLPDGNKRAAWACLVLFLDLNEGSWNNEQPDTLTDQTAREADEQPTTSSLSVIHPARSARFCVSKRAAAE